MSLKIMTRLLHVVYIENEDTFFFLSPQWELYWPRFLRFTKKEKVLTMNTALFNIYHIVKKETCFGHASHPSAGLKLF
jgi:hypothetical protein